MFLHTVAHSGAHVVSIRAGIECVRTSTYYFATRSEALAGHLADHWGEIDSEDKADAIKELNGYYEADVANGCIPAHYPEQDLFYAVWPEDDEDEEG